MKKQDLNGVRTPEDVERRHKLGAIPTLEEDVEGLKEDIIVDSQLSSSSTHPVQNKVISDVLNSLNNNKVDKVSGKGLSTNDFTNDDKDSIHVHSNKSALDSITSEKINQWDNNSIQNAFPINKVEIFFDNLDHSNFLGFSWELISQGKMPIGINTNDSDFDTIGKTGGEKTHTLNISEIPSHTHTTNLGLTDDLNFTSDEGQYPPADAPGTKSITYSSNATGGGQAHNNMPPFIVMAFWKRIA